MKGISEEVPLFFIFSKSLFTGIIIKLIIIWIIWRKILKILSDKKGRLRSCSTFAAMQGATSDGSVIFAKNSDRPVNESQPLEYHPPAEHEPGEKVKCTYIEIPQVSHTYGYIGSRPYNIYGFEHGINEKGVIIGNEAVKGRETPEKQWGLIGMDLLRLALERSESAVQAVELMGELLETYGTGGDPLIRPQYFNANYIVADFEEAYIFESCQRMWAAKKIESMAHIGNLYGITDDYHIIGKDVVKTAFSKGWCRDEERINIAQTFSLSDCDYEDGEAYFRYLRQEELLRRKEPVTVERMMEILRDHYDEYRKPLPYDVATSKMPTICCHPGGMNGCTSAASVVCSLDRGAEDPFKFIYWGSMAPPCCSVFIPQFNVGWIPEELGKASALYENNSPWWVFTELERYIALSYDDFAPQAAEVFKTMEGEFIERVEVLKKEYDGDTDILKNFSHEAVVRSVEAAVDLKKQIEKEISTVRINPLMTDYFKDSAEVCGMPYMIEI